MPSVASFVEQAREELLAGNAERAIAVCQHVLAYFPKHLEVNGLLAEALRNLGADAEARDLFLRVVSADPHNLFARWALSLLAEAAGDAEWAAWELQRAWEVSPAYPDLRPDLRQEIERLTGRPPATSVLALTHAHAAAGLFETAIAALRELLAAEPTRLDVALALAEVFWRAEQPDEAVRLCQVILDDSPDCLRANVLLGLIFSTGAADARERGRRLLQRALALDPAGTVAAELLGGRPLPDGLAPPPTELPPLPQTAPAPEAAATPESGRAAAPSPPAPDAAAATRERPHADLADWLRDPAEEAASAQEALASRLTRGQPAPRPAEAGETLAPEWHELLSEEIALDDESRTLVDRALAGSGPSEPVPPGPGWVRVETVAPDTGPRLADVAHAPPPVSPPPAVPTPAPAAPSSPAPAAPSGLAAEPAAILSRASVLWHGGNPDMALEEYRKALRLAPQAAALVADELVALLAAYPSQTAAHRLLADVYMRIGRFREAAAEYGLARARPG